MALHIAKQVSLNATLAVITHLKMGPLYRGPILRGVITAKVGVLNKVWALSCLGPPRPKGLCPNPFIKEGNPFIKGLGQSPLGRGGPRQDKAHYFFCPNFKKGGSPYSFKDLANR
jgi:hypothetical protein